MEGVDVDEEEGPKPRTGRGPVLSASMLDPCKALPTVDTFHQHKHLPDPGTTRR